MQVVAFPQCCTANVLIGMGRTHTAGYDAMRASVSNGTTDMDMTKQFIQQMNSAKRQGLATLVVTLNSDQTQANRVLESMRKLGWRSSNWMTKRNHKETQLRIWYFRVDQYTLKRGQNFLAKLT